MVTELDESQAESLDVLEVPYPEELLFQSAEEALNAAVPLRLADEGRRRGYAEEHDLGMEVVAPVLDTMVMAQLQAAFGPGAEGGELFAHAPAPRRLALPIAYAIKSTKRSRAMLERKTELRLTAAARSARGISKLRPAGADTAGI